MDSDNQSISSEIKNNEIHIPNNYQHVDESSIIDPVNIIKTSKDVYLFELPKNFDKSNLTKLKIKSFDLRKLDNICDSYSGLVYDDNDTLTKQSVAMCKMENGVKFLKFNKYVKIFECFDLDKPKAENVIPRRIIYKNQKKKKERGKKSSN